MSNLEHFDTLRLKVLYNCKRIVDIFDHADSTLEPPLQLESLAVATRSATIIHSLSPPNTSDVLEVNFCSQCSYWKYVREWLFFNVVSVK